ncbi:Glutathione S-transferase GST-6.0 [Saezia sanguinis]|uniref:Glutathione S-transferase GST-6.0 n=1 Tax=Saezia sanguinis TaxID=1965230 RepID=A0A433SDA6_9BURK|nr:glutathione binding-like protein [Saezia sanguinis]RUS66721.1 Glutathione S-transferase GST-6.0 [Saezia sanguinis]
MKLYFASEASALAPHIILIEQNIPYELIRVNYASMHTSEGGDFREINPNGYVPALTLDDGKILTEGPAIIQYLADLKPETKLAPPQGSWERVELWEILNFMSNELHALCAPLFMAEIPDEVKEIITEKLEWRLGNLANRMKGRSYVMGEHFTIVDAYLFPILSWMPRFSVDLEQWPELANWMDVVSERPSVQRAHQEEIDVPAV